MANTITIRKGTSGEAALASLASGELGFETNTGALIVGTGGGADTHKTVVMKDLYDANTFLYATADNTPVVKTQAETLALLSSQASAPFAMNTQKITGVDTPTEDGDAVNKSYADGLVGGAGAVIKTDFNATTFMYALEDDLPLPKNIAETLTILGVESGADATDATNVNAAGAVMETDYTATSFMYATADNTPEPKTPAQVKVILDLEIGTDVLAQQAIGIANGNLVDIDDGAGIVANDYTKFTATGLVGKSYSEVIGDLSGQAAADFAMGGNKITGLTDPTAAQDAATKASSEAYADAVASGLDLKNSVVTATTEVLPACTPAGSKVGKTLTGDAFGLLSVDGQAVVQGERLLVKNQAAGEDNGIYTVTTIGAGDAYFVLTRATDADQDVEVTAGMYCFIEEGTANADEGWVLTTNDVITVDTTALAFSQFSSAEFVDTFLELDDTPAAFDDGKILRSTAAAVEFVTFATEYLEVTPTEDLGTKAPTSEWAFDHAAATTGVHGAGGNTIMHSASAIDGGAF